MTYYCNMNADRLFKIIISDLTSERLKLEENLENVINSDLEIDYKVATVKELLKEITLTESSLIRFTNMLSDDETNNDTNKEN